MLVGRIQLLHHRAQRERRGEHPDHAVIAQFVQIERHAARLAVVAEPVRQIARRVPHVTGADVRELAHRITQIGELEIHHALHAHIAEQELPRPGIALHQHQALGHFRQVPPQPAAGETDQRHRLVDQREMPALPDREIGAHKFGCITRSIEADLDELLRRNRVPARHHLREIPRDRIALRCSGQRREIVHTGDEFEDRRVRLIAGGDDLGHGDAFLAQQAQHARLALQPVLAREAEITASIAADVERADRAACVHVDKPAGTPAGFATALPPRRDDAPAERALGPRKNIGLCQQLRHAALQGRRARLRARPDSTRRHARRSMLHTDEALDRSRQQRRQRSDLPSAIRPVRRAYPRPQRLSCLRARQARHEIHGAWPLLFRKPSFTEREQ